MQGALDGASNGPATQAACPLGNNASTGHRGSGGWGGGQGSSSQGRARGSCGVGGLVAVEIVRKPNSTRRRNPSSWQISGWSFLEGCRALAFFFLWPRSSIMRGCHVLKRRRAKRERIWGRLFFFNRWSCQNPPLPARQTQARILPVRRRAAPTVKHRPHEHGDLLTKQPSFHIPKHRYMRQKKKGGAAIGACVDLRYLALHQRPRRLAMSNAHE